MCSKQSRSSWQKLHHKIRCSSRARSPQVLDLCVEQAQLDDGLAEFSVTGLEFSTEGLRAHLLWSLFCARRTDKSFPFTAQVLSSGATVDQTFAGFLKLPNGAHTGDKEMQGDVV